MGDPSTHVILYSEYWWLVYEDNGAWINSSGNAYLCQIGAEEKKLKLKDIK